MKENKEGIISGTTAGLVFLVLLFVVRSGFVISILAGAATYCLFEFLILRKKKVLIVAEGVTQDDLDEVLAEGSAKLKSLEGAAKNIKDPQISKKVNDIIAVASAIYADIKKEPGSVKQARKFITYYMDTADYIVQRYLDLADNSEYVANGAQMIQKISTALDGLNQIFFKLKSKLMEDDLFELDTEIKLLEQTIKSEGI